MSTSAARTSDDSVCSDWIFEQNFALRFYDAVGTPRAVRQATLLNLGEFSELNGFPCGPEHYQEPEHFAADYQVTELLRKSMSIPGTDGRTREKKALSKFLAAEERNAETNTRLMADVMPSWFGDFSSHVLRILGPLGESELNEIAELGKFGPGVNVGVRGDGLVPSIKYEAKPVATKALAPLLSGVMPVFVKEYWNKHLNEKTVVVGGNGHFTVPKDWEIDRCAAKEPLWNSYIQAGAGRKMAKRLQRFGVNLHDQQWNQTLAEKAWEWGLATLDLSSASDMLTRVLVWLALCYNQDPVGKRWFHLLNTIRSPAMKIDGQWKALEMFASMGNGFTFPLETIIFLSVIRATVPRDEWCVSTAYGDDMIVPQQYARQVVERLEYLGFKPNLRKTCLAGVFFESCGTDWFKSQNVRPFYLHKDPSNPIPYAMQAANSLRAWCIRVFGCLPAAYAPLWRWCKGQIPNSWLRLVPPELGDCGLHVSLAEAVANGSAQRCPDQRGAEGPVPKYNGWEGYIVKFVRLAPVNKDRKQFGVICGGLSQLEGASIDRSSSKGLEPVRGLYGRLRTETGVVLWKDDFCWRKPA